MANQGALTGLGNVVKVHKGFRAEINTRFREERYKITGPSREREHQAHDDLRCIRASAEAASNRLDGLGAMRSTAYELREAARTTAIHSPWKPGRPWAPIFLKSNINKYIGAFSLLFAFTC